ncbi:MAG: hypothetical protein J6B79_05845 [Clostridia bacterium]|nr:hypothetical protein [Clostridia bacterium]
MAKLNELTKEQKIDYLRKNPIFWAKWCDGGDSTNYYSIEDALFDAQKDSDKYATTVKNIYDSGIEVFSVIIHNGWMGVDDFDYSCVDFQINRFFETVPNAYLIPRIRFNAPIDWCKKYPEDVHVYSHGPKTAEEIRALVDTKYHDKLGFPNSENRGVRENGAPLVKICMQSFCSDRWRKDAGEAIRKLVRHIESLPYADRIIGYHVTYGMCGETSMWGAWENELEFHGDYGINTTKKFIEYARERGVEVDRVPTPIEREVIKDKDTVVCDVPTILTAVKDKTFSAIFYETAGEKPSELYSRFISENNADAIDHFCSIIKEETADKLAGAFYGYIIAIHNSCDSGHLAIDKLLSSKNVDFVSGPKGYWRVDSGDPGFPQAITQSINLKKLWLDEVDNRTHAATNADCNIARNMSETRSALWREFTKNLSANQGYWFMDLMGGWYDDEEILAEMTFIGDTAKLLSKREQKSVTEILLVLDDEVMHQMRPYHTFNSLSVYDLGTKIKECGAPVDTFRRCDLDTIDLSGYKLIIFMNPFVETRDTYAKIKDKISPGATVMFDFAPAVFDGKKAELQNIEDFIGLSLGLLDNVQPLPEFPKNNIPLIFVRSDGVEVIKRYSSGEAMTVRRGNEIYCALPEILDLADLRTIMKSAGVHIYADEKFSINADSRFIFVTSPCDFDGTLKMPKKVTAVNLFTGERFVDTDALPCSYKGRQSAFFLIE